MVIAGMEIGTISPGLSAEGFQVFFIFPLSSSSSLLLGTMEQWMCPAGIDGA
jgi:hypothetical protein